MSKAFTREGDEAPDEVDAAAVEHSELPPGAKNYITPEGFKKLQDELKHLVRDERPKVVETVAWAAGNGDRSENGDYIYGKKRLREIDSRIHFLTKRMEIAEVVNPAAQKNRDQAFFGATVTYAAGGGAKHTVTIVGVDEADADRGNVSWVSPVAKALLKARVGDTVELRSPGGVESIEVVSIKYPGEHPDK
ncbi:MAG TPA: transcription elongation factor GreB [Stellaceae bacterium]|nr:transcription elongation factor GreB [Stellaceae bacterium]